MAATAGEAATTAPPATRAKAGIPAAATSAAVGAAVTAGVEGAAIAAIAAAIAAAGTGQAWASCEDHATPATTCDYQRSATFNNKAAAAAAAGFERGGTANTAHQKRKESSSGERELGLHFSTETPSRAEASAASRSAIGGDVVSARS